LAGNAEQKNRLNSAGNKNYTLFIFAILMFEVIVLCPGISQMNPFAVTPYFLSYQDFGFNSRLFVGTIFKMCSYYISSAALYCCILMIIIGMNAFVALTLGGIMRRSSHEQQERLSVFVLLFLASPFSLSFLFDAENFGRLDIYLVIITVVMMRIVKHKYLRWLIPVLSFTAVAIYQGYVMTYMPVMAVILVYECYKNKFRPASLLLCGSTFLSIITLSVYFQYFAPGFNFENARAVKEYLTPRTDYNLSEILIFTEYFINVVYSFSYQIQIVKSFAAPYTVNILIMTSPLIAVFIYLWTSAFRSTRDRFLKFVIFLCPASPLISLPIFIGNDWDRWISAIFISQFALAFYFLHEGFECVTQAAGKIRAFFAKHAMLFFAVLIFESSMVFSGARLLFFTLQQSAVNIFYEMLENAGGYFR